MWPKRAQMTSQISEYSLTITSIPSLVRAEWLKCWGCQDLLWVILELRVTKPHSWTHRHISPGFVSRQVLKEGTDGLVQFSSGSTEQRHPRTRHFNVGQRRGLRKGMEQCAGEPSPMSSRDQESARCQVKVQLLLLQYTTRSTDTGSIPGTTQQQQRGTTCDMNHSGSTSWCYC